MSFHSYAHSILWFTKKLASNSSAGGGSPTSFFNSNYLLSHNINSLLRLRVGMHIIYIYIYIYLLDERYILEVEMKTIKNYLLLFLRSINAVCFQG